MTDILLSVPSDDPKLPSWVEVPAAQVTGIPDSPDDIGAATAEQGALADATKVEQVTLTAPLVYALPTGLPSGVVHRVTFTQDASGGHTVTYGGSPVSVDLTPGAVTTVDFYPTGTGYAVRYPVADVGARVSAFAALKAALKDGQRSCAVQVLSDSTADGTSDWPHEFAELLAANYPAWTVHYMPWSDATQSYAATEVIQTGTDGVRYLDPTTGTDTRRLAASQSPHIAGVIDVRVKLTMDNWTTPASSMNICGRAPGAPSRSWYFRISTSGILSFVYSTEGTNVVTRSAVTTLGLANGATSWIRAVFTPDDGAGNNTTSFWKSPDGIAWTQVGTTVTAAGAVTLFNPAAGTYECGGLQGVSVAIKTHEIQIRDGLNGPNVVPAMPDLWPPYDNDAVTATGAPVLTIVNGSTAGAGFAYLSDISRLPKLTPDYGQLVCFSSVGHNEIIKAGREWTVAYEAFRVAIQARTDAPIIVLTQNPETVVSNYWFDHASRRLTLIGWARQKGIDCIDTFQSFLDYGGGGGAWSALMSDDVHPNATGQALWAATVAAAFRAS